MKDDEKKACAKVALRTVVWWAALAAAVATLGLWLASSMPHQR